VISGHTVKQWLTWCSVKHIFKMLLYSKEYTFSILFVLIRGICNPCYTRIVSCSKQTLFYIILCFCLQVMQQILSAECPRLRWTHTATWGSQVGDILTYVCSTQLRRGLALSQLSFLHKFLYNTHMTYVCVKGSSYKTCIVVFCILMSCSLA
jgi:hypothetical protein